MRQKPARFLLCHNICKTRFRQYIDRCIFDLFQKRFEQLLILHLHGNCFGIIQLRHQEFSAVDGKTFFEQLFCFFRMPAQYFWNTSFHGRQEKVCSAVIIRRIQFRSPLNQCGHFADLGKRFHIRASDIDIASPAECRPEQSRHIVF